MSPISSTSASRSREILEREAEETHAAAVPSKPVARDVDLETIGSDILHAASLAVFGVLLYLADRCPGAGPSAIWNRLRRFFPRRASRLAPSPGKMRRPRTA